MAKIHEFTFGSIVVGGKKCRRDILIFADGTVKKRKGGFLMFRSHKIKKRELEELSQGQPDMIIAGRDTNSTAHTAFAAQSRAKEKNLDLLVQLSYDAIAKAKKLTAQNKIATLTHITC